MLLLLKAELRVQGRLSSECREPSSGLGWKEKHNNNKKYPPKIAFPGEIQASKAAREGHMAPNTCKAADPPSPALRAPSFPTRQQRLMSLDEPSSGNVQIPGWFGWEGTLALC